MWLLFVVIDTKQTNNKHKPNTQNQPPVFDQRKLTKNSKLNFSMNFSGTKNRDKLLVFTTQI